MHEWTWNMVFHVVWIPACRCLQTSVTWWPRWTAAKWFGTAGCSPRVTACATAWPATPTPSCLSISWPRWDSFHASVSNDRCFRRLLLLFVRCDCWRTYNTSGSCDVKYWRTFCNFILFLTWIPTGYGYTLQNTNVQYSLSTNVLCGRRNDHRVFPLS